MESPVTLNLGQVIYFPCLAPEALCLQTLRGALLPPATEKIVILQGVKKTHV